MRFKKSSLPGPGPGVINEGPSEVVPDQSMSLLDILTRFTRGEVAPVAHSASYGSEIMDPESESELNVDLEKLRYADLTEKDEYKEKALNIQRDYDQLEKAREKEKADKKAADEKAAYEKSVRIAARKLAAKSGGKPDSI